MTRSDRRKAILETATKLFDQHGYRNTGMQDIARAIGIQAPSLYNHFPSKQAILAEICVGIMSELLSLHARSLAGTGDPLEKLRQSMAVQVRFHCEKQLETRVCWREEKNLEETDRGHVAQLRRDYTGRWMALVQEGQDAGYVRTGPSALLANALIDMGAGVGNWFQAGRSMSISDIADLYSSLAEQALSPPPQPRPDKQTQHLIADFN